MTIKINIEPNKSPVIERYENDLKVGGRKISIMDLQKMFAKELAIDELLNVLIHDRHDEFSFMLEHTNMVDNSAQEFITTIFNHINMQLSNSKNSSGVSTEALLKHSIVNASNFEMNEFNQLIVNWLSKLTSSGIDCSEPIKDVINCLKYEDMPISSMLDVLATWTKRFKYAVAKGEFLGNDERVIVELIQALLNTDNQELKQCLIELTMKSSTESSEMSKWLQAGLPVVSEAALEAEIERRRNIPTKKEVRFFSPLPRNASFMASTNHGNVFYYDLKKQSYYCKYHSKILKEKVGFPRLLFALTVNDHFEVVSAKLAAIKGDEPLSTSTKLYRYPYSNVYSNGNLCFTYQGIACDDLPDAFLSASNNAHLNPGGFEIFKKYEGIDFDDDILQPLHVNVAEFY